MTPPPGFVRRFERVTEALGILTMYPDGLPLSRLAAELNVDEKTLRDEIIAFYRADIDPAFAPGTFRQVRIEFVGLDGALDGGLGGGFDDDVDPGEAEIVRASTEQPTAEIGIVHSSPAELANVYLAGHALLTVEPHNAVLDEALRSLSDTMLQGIRPVDDHWKAELADTLLDAIQQQRRVLVSYVSLWCPEPRDHIIAPYRLLRTRRGWELDAAIEQPDDVGTFLLSGIRHTEIVDETFERPADVDRQIEADRRGIDVDIVVPQDAQWVVDRFAESSAVLAEDEESVKLRAHILPPADRRVGVMLLVAGPCAFVTAPHDLVDAGSGLAADLLDHHRQA